MRFDDALFFARGWVQGLQFQSGDGPHHNRTGQFGHNAFVAAAVTAHLQVMRTHIGKGLGVLHALVFRRRQANGMVIGADLHLPFVGAAMKQVHVA